VSLPFAGTDPAERDAGASQSVLVRLTDPSGVGEARRTAVTLAGFAGLSRDDLSNLSIVVNELASNAVRHGGGGLVVMRQLREDQPSGIEILCIDRGPGMTDLAGCFRDGYSSSGTMGTGLGAARRIAHAFDIFSAPGQGTVAVARLWAGGAPPEGRTLVGALALPVAGERECGDGWAVVAGGTKTHLLLVDGLGHGAGAAEASRLAVRLFGEHGTRSPADVLEVLHRGLRHTRGAAVGIAEVDPAAGQLRFAGVGNIAARILTEGGMRSLVSHNGIVGLHSVRAHEFTYPFASDAMLVLHSDGLTSHWKHEAYPGFLRRDPAIAAALLYRDAERGRDDVSVVAYRAAARPLADR
jgi:anti-sigma regulatory factor (Ser/Thr protein kinase)